MNEEEVKVRIVVPWLQQHGFALEDLKLEHAFTIKVGRQSIPIGGAQSTAHRARFDILVQRGEKNLFIVETKALNLPLTDDDRDQAISYARLVHPIAPYALVTNGREFRLYHSITRDRIEPDRMRELGFDVQLPDEALLETQTRFLRLSRANLSLFCGQQIESELRRVRGPLASGRKYVPELHEPRVALQETFANFLSSDAACLLLSGASGAGKTCELCFLAELLPKNERPALFFIGTALLSNLYESIAAEFSWSFDVPPGPIQILKRIESVLAEGHLVLIIDAIDEWASDSAIQQLDALVRAAEGHRIKVILSCKSTAAASLRAVRGNPTLIEVASTKAVLPLLTEREFYKAVDRYKEAYRFNGGFERAVLSQARENPFLLRVLFDVARTSAAKHLTFSSEDFFKRYYERSLAKFNKAAEADEILFKVAELLWEHNADAIPQPMLRQALSLRTGEPLFEELFEYDLLVRTPGTPQECKISFYFQQLRDYLVAFRVLRLNEMPLADLRKVVDTVAFPSIRGDVFTLYYRLAPRERQAVFDSELRANARCYLDCYVSLLREHFPSVRAFLEPAADEPIGFIGEVLLARRELGMCGFRKLETGEDAVLFVPVDQLMDDSNLSRLEGARYGMQCRSSSRGFRDGIQIHTEVVDHEIIPRIGRLIQESRLDESDSTDLQIELVIETVQNERAVFGALFVPRTDTIRSPLELDAVLACVQRAKLKRHFEDEIVRRGRKSGKIKEHWSGSCMSYGYQRTREDDLEVAARVDKAMQSREMPEIRTRYLQLEALERRMLEAVRILRAHGVETIECEAPGDRITLGVNGFSVPASKLKRYLKDLMVKSQAIYRALAERNFPTLRQGFAAYSRPPEHQFLVLGPPAVSLSEWNLRIYSAPSPNGESLCEFAEDVERKTGEDGTVHLIDGVAYRNVSINYTSVANCLGGGGDLGDMHLRSRVYSLLAGEWASTVRRLKADPSRKICA